MRSRSLSLISMLLGSLIACGGGSHFTPQNPLFTSTPVTAASQGASYSYLLAATDPSGGTVTFSLIAAPPGATLNSATINWMPTAPESRISNSFVARATTTSGGTATQSWTVTPTGTVTVNWINTDWTPSGQVQIPAPPTLVPSALVPQADGSLQLISGNLASPGVYTILQVPGGYYWLVEFTAPGLPPIAFWTQSSVIDLGRDVAGSPRAAGASQTTTFDFNLSGLDPSQTPGVVGFIPDNLGTPPIYLAAQPGSPDLTGSVSITSSIDWTQVTNAFLAQLEPSSLGPFNNLVLGPELTLSNLTLANGATNPVTAALVPSPQASVDLNIPGSKWASLFQNVAPSVATPIGSWLALAQEPYVIGVNAKPQLFAPSFGGSFYMVQPDPSGGLPFALSSCPDQPFFLPAAFSPPVVTDQDFGTLQYGDPFPANWTRLLMFCQSATVPFTVGSNTFPMPLNFAMTVPPSSPALTPLAGPVVNPTINGSSLFTTTSENTTVASLSWSAPTSGSPYGYTVYVFQLIPLQNGLDLLVMGTYGTAQTSMTLPPLPAGHTYLFLIITQADGIANMETSPYRSQLPTGFATVMSAQITITAGASGPQLRGDPKQLKRFLQPQGQRYRMTSDGHSCVLELEGFGADMRRDAINCVSARK